MTILKNDLVKINRNKAIIDIVKKLIYLETISVIFHKQIDDIIRNTY